MKTNKLYIIIIILISMLLYSCSIGKKKNIKLENENIYIKQKVSVINKKINSLDDILGDTINVAKRIVFIYNGLDCETCIDKGYLLAKKIDKIRNKKIVYVITTSTNIARDQLRNNYLEYVFYDEHDLIRKDLKYILTPAFVFFDAEEKIKFIYYPGLENEDEENIFIKNCFKL